MRKRAEYWLNMAKDDLSVIEEIIDRGDLTHMVAFHSQQAIEKSLKALLEEKGMKVPRTHNLIVLKNEADKHYKIDVDEGLLTGINETYIDARYPTDLGLLPSGKPNQKTARDFADLAFSIFRAIKEFLTD